jgi:hypothetical protein
MRQFVAISLGKTPSSARADSGTAANGALRQFLRASLQGRRDMGKEPKDEDDPTGLRKYAKIIGEMNGEDSKPEQPEEPPSEEPEATSDDGTRSERIVAVR